MAPNIPSHPMLIPNLSSQSMDLHGFLSKHNEAMCQECRYRLNIAGLGSGNLSYINTFVSSHSPVIRLTLLITTCPMHMFNFVYIPLLSQSGWSYSSDVDTYKQ
ncbi:hypothetical protein BDB01DRAFT_839349 [Pilobolus umbonatus]|nr:hypothetical protein BDB01DRAFT_839349 [Pilobolus umbonatus]